jgi:hypothetical protein
MADYEVMHIAIAPPANPDANLVRSVATVINKSPYDTRLLLAGIEFAPKGGYSLASGGKPDTVFNRLVVEYKAPGKLDASNSHTNNRKAIKQLRDYLDDVAKESKQRVERLAGIILDGNYFIFVRKFGNRWYEDSPIATSADSVARFLRYLIYLAYGVALTADNLVNDFGIDQFPARSMIAALEKALTSGGSPFRLNPSLSKGRAGPSTW